jgi:hypothetical protein
LGLFALVAAAAAVFLIAGCAFGIKEIRDIPVWILRKR